MKRCGYAAIAAIASAFALGAIAGAATAGNPHGTPPGQATQSSSTSSSASTSSQTSSQAPAPSSKYAGCTGSTSQGAGVKPDSTTLHDTCAAAGSKQTKLYGNGKTAGQIAMSRGAGADTQLRGPGNSQPHKVAVCPKNGGKVHYVDVHAVKSYSSSSCASSKTTTSSTSNTSSTTSTSSSTTNTSSSTTATSSPTVTTAAPATVAAPAAGKPSSGPAASGVAGATKTITSRPARTHAGAAAPRSGVLGATARTGSLPFTGVPLWIPALAALGLLAAGLGLRRHRSSQV
jgi:hypothetical protein